MKKTLLMLINLFDFTILDIKIAWKGRIIGVETTLLQ